MARQVSRENSGPPELKGAIRPDVVGLRDLNEKIVEDRPDPAAAEFAALLQKLDGID